jgi:hypothetical protein
MVGPKSFSNGELLSYSPHFHLARLKVRHHKDLRIEEVRKQICDAVIDDLRRSDPWIDQEAVPKYPVAPARS